MKILVINNDGGGFADYTEVDEGTTVAELFERQIGAKHASNYGSSRSSARFRLSHHPTSACLVLCSA
jgi:hypothetical protein